MAESSSVESKPKKKSNSSGRPARPHRCSESSHRRLKKAEKTESSAPEKQPEPVVCPSPSSIEVNKVMIDDEIDFSPAFLPHRLQSSYAFWVLHGSRGERKTSWEDCLKYLVSFRTVEGFWASHQHMKAPSMLDGGSDYYLFKDDIKPTWEDENNVKGGRWLVCFEQAKREELDCAWTDLLIALIGEQFSESEYICGAAVSVGKKHKEDKISIWTRDATDDEMNLRIGTKMKTLLKIGDEQKMKYVVHKASSSRANSKLKTRLTIPSQQAKDYLTPFDLDD
ncbi:hypothetical protein L596_026150 [Steinernema carpocapsae]|uniref:eIF-4F 25 kDa subunit n=1 Tax=Steinernema carpocapsae TaxID=34508 RepID=A0A4U5M0I3_STECR|nr:hypothetical protein L596_026150 [Steinernema carpocapsae]